MTPYPDIREQMILHALRLGASLVALLTLTWVEPAWPERYMMRLIARAAARGAAHAIVTAIQRQVAAARPKAPPVVH